MPVYDYKCKKCAHEFETYNQIDKRRNQDCEKCGKSCDLVFSPTTSIITFEPYYDTQLGHMVTSQRQKDRVAKSLGLTNAGDASLDEIERIAKSNKERKDQEDLNERPTPKFLEAYRKAQALYPNAE